MTAYTRDEAVRFVHQIALISDEADGSPEGEEATEIILNTVADALDILIQAALEAALQQTVQAIADNKADIVRLAAARQS